MEVAAAADLDYGSPMAELFPALLALAVVVLLPLLSAARFERLKATLAATPGARLDAYRTAVASQWVLAALSVWAVSLEGDAARLADLPTSWGSRELPPAAAPWVFGLSAGLVLGLVGVVLRVRQMPEAREELARALEPVLPLLPHTATERRMWVLVSVTAGVCEEVVFRGFLTSYLLPRVEGEMAALVLASLAFGIGHLYQGLRGVVSTGALGLLLGLCTLATGSLLPAVVLHALVDLRVLALPLPQR